MAFVEGNTLLLRRVHNKDIVFCLWMPTEICIHNGIDKRCLATTGSGDKKDADGVSGNQAGEQLNDFTIHLELAEMLWQIFRD